MVMMTRWKMHCTLEEEEEEEEVKLAKKSKGGEKKEKEKERKKIMKQLCDGARSHAQSARA